MITSETQVRDFQKSQPLPSFRLNSSSSNPFVPNFPALVTGTGPHFELTWKSEAAKDITLRENANRSGALLNMADELRREARRFPDSAKVRVNLAIALLNQGILDEAEAELGEGLRLDPNNYLAKINLARLRAHCNQFDEAVSLYNEILTKRPDDKTALLSLAAIALRRSDYAEAERLLNRAAASRECEATIHFLLGLVRLYMNNLAGAIAELRIAARADVRNPAVHQALGIVFALRSEFDRAEQEFRATLLLAPNDRASIRSLYQVLLNQKKTGEAVDILKSFVERNPSDLGAREALALGLLDLKKFGSARFHLTRMLADVPAGLPVDQVARIQANIGLSWLLEGKEESARVAIKRAIETYPRVSPIAYENLARLYLGQENTEAAQDILLQAKAIFPESLATALLLAHVNSLLGDFREAIKGLEIFRTRNDVPVEFYVHLSFFYSQIHSFDASMDAAKEGLTKFPHSAILVNNLAYVYAMTDQLEEARAALKRVPKDIKPTVELTATKGLLRLREGDERRGTELYAEAERLAAEMGNKALGRRVRQKKHLELARYLIRKKSFKGAAVEIKQGLAVHVKHFAYKDELIRLSEALESGVSG
jgi:tetratricopeptide (TPR) repeat protein